MAAPFPARAAGAVSGVGRRRVKRARGGVAPEAFTLHRCARWGLAIRRTGRAEAAPQDRCADLHGHAPRSRTNLWTLLTGRVPEPLQGRRTCLRLNVGGR